MKLDILCNYWDDPRGLMRLLESPGLANITNTIHVLDGKYVDHTAKPEYIQDLTQSVISNYNQGNWNGKINYQLVNGLTQVEKRNTLWADTEMNDPDFVIVLDSDEHVELNIDVFELELKGLSQSESCCFDLEAHHWGHDYKLPRLFKKYSKWNFRHLKSHGSLHDLTRNNREIIDDRHSQGPVKGFKIIHDKATRSANRAQLDKKYREIPDH